MAYTEYTNNNSPQAFIQVWTGAYRNKQNVTFDATCTCTFKYPSGGGLIGRGYEVLFWFWVYGIQYTAVISSTDDTWRASSEASRTVKIYSNAITLTGGTTQGVAYQVYSNLSSGAMQMPYTETGVDYPTFNGVTKPTWISATPNPCEINQAPLITWGGASAGSMGTLVYDIQVQSSKPDGSWTDWLTIGSGRAGTSYPEIPLKNMNVLGQTAFIGVKYQYRVRSSDAQYTTSDWIYITISTSFISPSTPRSSWWNVSSLPKNATRSPFTLSWSGATGGSGNITGYKIVFRAYHQATKSWTDWAWTQAYTTNTSNKTFWFPESVSKLEPFKNNDRIQAAIMTINSWGADSGWYWSPELLIRGNQVWIKINGSWREGEPFIKINGSWKEGEPFVKINGSWRESN